MKEHTKIFHGPSIYACKIFHQQKAYFSSISLAKNLYFIIPAKNLRLPLTPIPVLNT